MSVPLQAVCTHCMNVWVTTEKPDVSALSGRLLADCPRCGYTGFVTGEVLPEGTLEDAAQRRLKQYGETATIPCDCPWIDPPAWWDKGLKAWGELLTEQWEAAGAEPETAQQQWSRRLFAEMMRLADQDRVDVAIKILMEEIVP